MEDQPQSLRTLFSNAENQRHELAASPTSTGATFQENLSSAILTFEECLRVADRVCLFSPNETLEDISSSDLQYLLLHYRLAELILRSTAGDRKGVLKRARIHYERFLKLLDNYDALSKENARMLERYNNDRGKFSTASTTDSAARREAKIARFREEKELKKKLDHLRQNPTATRDEAAVRSLHLTDIALSVHHTFESLESLALEFQILAFAPPPSHDGQGTGGGDLRQRNGHGDGYSERLDAPSSLSAGLKGPILDKDGRPMRPFTLLDNRSRMRQGVFRPDHSLPTMTIDEYLEEERKRGGIIEGGGPQSGVQPEPDEDDLDKADEETMKARAWDDFKEENPRGSGNTLNMG